jgi:hypothetical protein
MAGLPSAAASVRRALDGFFQAPKKGLDLDPRFPMRPTSSSLRTRRLLDRAGILRAMQEDSMAYTQVRVVHVKWSFHLQMNGLLDKGSGLGQVGHKSILGERYNVELTAETVYSQSQGWCEKVGE